MSYDRNKLIAELKRDEGYRDTLYLDSENILTLGIGHALGSRPLSAVAAREITAPGVADIPFPEKLLDVLFLEDLHKHEIEVRELAGRRGVIFDSLSDARQRVLINMCFNMGAVRLGGFRLMWKALVVGDFKEAAAQMLDSRWATQVGARSIRLHDMMLEG